MVELDSDPKREEAELRAYLGDEYDHSLLQDYQGTLAREFSQCGDEPRFYRTSKGYLYNLTVFAMSQTKLPYLQTLTRVLPPGSRVLDYGCGIGSDGLMLLTAGYDVEFADFDNPSVEYLRWRLRRRGLNAPIHDLDRGVPDGFDGAFAFDVIEHVEDPHAFIGAMEARARVVIVNLLEPEPNDQEIHHELPIREMVGRAARRRLLKYRVYYGRSHLLAYDHRPGGPIWRLRGRLRLMLAAARRAGSH
ncbi:MAG: class I SAM-dependent methyltransferase [Actinomycetota bacterium]|nr:class I SAM-dependent methyltransferase [Actinomycetota bacterium]